MLSLSRYTKYLFMALVLVPAAAIADESKLYDPVPPADASFVRVFNASAADFNADLGSVDFGGIKSASASAYNVFKQGAQSLKAGNIAGDLDIKSGKYYTVIINGSSHNLVEDELLENASKAKIYFYNGSDAAASLIATEHKTEIFKNVAAGENTARDINALTIDVQVQVDGKEVQTFSKVELKRRVGTSIFVSGKAGSYKASLVENSVIK